jgi:glycosyltransferase involved in cell wall biosynthesis
VGKSNDPIVKLYVDASPLSENKVTGIPHFTAELVKALERHPENGKSFKIILLIAFDKKKKLSKWGFTKLDIKTIPLPMRFLNLFWKYEVLPPMDVFLGRGVYLFPNYKNWRLLNSPSLTYIHDLGFVRYPQYVQPKNQVFLSQGIQKWISRTTKVLTGSDYTKEEIITLLKVPPEKVVRIYHGVDKKLYYPRTSLEINSAKTKYDIKGDYMLYVGSIEPRKNLSSLIESYRNLPSDLLEKYSLCLVGGGGWLNDDILETIKSSQAQGYKIIMPSKYVEDEDLPSLMSGAALLTYPAIYEGFGLPPLQAMACGVPVLVANNSSLPEVVGSAGVFVDAENIKDISAKIEKVLTDGKYRMDKIKAGLIQAKKFTWENSAQELINCMENVGSK